MRHALCAALLLIFPNVAAGQSDSTAADTTGVVRGLWARSPDASGLIVSTTKTYNRVEGVGLLFGPVYRDSLESVSISASAAGILRSADSFRWDAGNLGHDASFSLRFGRERRFGIGVQSYDVVDAVEKWQLTDPEAALAALFFHRDYRDLFGRHGGALIATVFTGAKSWMDIALRDERWSSREARDVFSVARNGEPWRPNPAVDDGRARVVDVTLRIDTRNETSRPASGWFTTAHVEHVRTDLARVSPGSGIVGSRDSRPGYGRLLVDTRRYTRLSPGDQLNARVVLGGRMYGDPLPLQRRFSVGGVGSIPGFDFRTRTGRTDVAQCSGGAPLPGNPAQCERVLLAQVEYRSQVAAGVFDRARSRLGRFAPRPVVVAFADAGRGWMVGDPLGDERYPSGSIPPFSTFMTDVGIGVDFGIAGAYVAKAVSVSKEPANFFVRIRSRF